MTIGISVDKLADQQAFAKKENLTYPLFSDAEKKIATTYGVLAPNGQFANRMSFVIDKQGTVRKVYTKAEPATHADEVLQYVKENLAKK